MCQSFNDKMFNKIIIEFINVVELHCRNFVQKITIIETAGIETIHEHTSIRILPSDISSPYLILLQETDEQ